MSTPTSTGHLSTSGTTPVKSITPVKPTTTPSTTHITPTTSTTTTHKSSTSTFISTSKTTPRSSSSTTPATTSSVSITSTITATSFLTVTTSSPATGSHSTSTTSTTTTASLAGPLPTAPTSPIYNVVGNGNFQYDASAPGGLAAWIALGDAKLVAGNAYHGDGNTGSYAVQLITESAAIAGRRVVRRQTSNGGAAGIEQILADLDETTQYTVSLWYYVDYTLAANAQPQNCRIDAYYGSTLFSSTPYFASNTGQASAWVQFVSTFTPSTSGGNLQFLLDCVSSGTAEALIDEVFVSNQVTPNDIDNISLTFTLAPNTFIATTISSTQVPSSVAATSIAPPNPTCTIHIISPAPAGATCQHEVASTGSSDELYIYGDIGIALPDCAAECLANSACGSMSWGPMSGAAQCILYPRSVASYATPASSSSGLYVWDQACWKYLGANGAACPGTPSSSITSSAPQTTTSTSTTTSTQMSITTTTATSTNTATGCSTTYPSPAATCTDLLPNPSPAANAVCGIAGAGIQNVYEGMFPSSASCQLGCLQSPTCKSWAYLTLCQFSDEEFLLSNIGHTWTEGGNGELWFDNECFFCAGDVPGSSCASTTTSATTPSTTATSPTICPTQLVLNPSFETYNSSNSAAAPWDFASFSSLQTSNTVLGAVDGKMYVELNPGFVAYNYGPYTGQPTSSSVTQSISCLDPTQTYTVDFYWYLHAFYQTQMNTGTTCSVYAQISGTTVFTTTVNEAAAQASTWDYTHVTANFVPTATTATLLIGADCGGNEGMVNVDFITIYPTGTNDGLGPDHEYPSP
ncbi:Muc22p [Xylographa pallens]|nr:Muc22p [Xylographa pallens]